MTLSHHSAAEHYERRCGEAELVTSQQRSYNYIPTYK